MYKYFKLLRTCRSYEQNISNECLDPKNKTLFEIYKFKNGRKYWYELI